MVPSLQASRSRVVVRANAATLAGSALRVNGLRLNRFFRSNLQNGKALAGDLAHRAHRARLQICLPQW